MDMVLVLQLAAEAPGQVFPASVFPAAAPAQVLVPV